MTRVLQLLSGAGPFDAITNQALAWQRMLAADGLDGEVMAAQLDPALDGAVRGIDGLGRRAGRDDLLVIHYSAHAPALERALELPQRKLLVYHNITPPHYLWEHEPYVAMICALGRERLGAYAGRVDAAVAPSAFSARDLEAAGFADVRVDRRLYEIDRGRLRPGAQEADRGAGPTVVFVGRLSHNKRQDRLVKAFALYQRTHAPEARLVLPGNPGSGTYGDHLAALAREVGATGVELPGGLPQERLNAIYAGADVFACLSEHEGFCIPLLEALHFGLPVVARRAAAVPEVLGDAGVLLDDPDLATVAEAIDLCVRGEALRAELRARGERRLAEFAPERTREAVRGAVAALL
ncbi:MAG TPA: glycosyltransferase family 4 protein [Solirubrobacteraceae bacterium]|nr:glycosyltransferase family 4 protein [Solirubrobacteraceae bacterium]